MATYTTYAAAAAAYLASADYLGTRSLAKARTHADACAALILLGPGSTSSAESAVSFDPQRFEKARDLAIDYIRRNSDETEDQGGVRTTRASFEFGRG